MANAVAKKVLDSEIPKDAVVEIKEELSLQHSAKDQNQNLLVRKGPRKNPKHRGRSGGIWGEGVIKKRFLELHLISGLFSSGPSIMGGVLGSLGRTQCIRTKFDHV